MQKYWLPFRNLENLDKNTKHQSTLIVEPIRKPILNNSKNESSKTRNVQFAKTFTVRNEGGNSEDLTEVQISRNEKAQHGFTTALIYANSVNDRKRPSTLTEESEPARKKFQSNNGSIIDSTTRNDSTTSKVWSENKLFYNKRCLTGDVSQILSFNKKIPSLDALHEVYANILKIDKSKLGQKNILLRNSTGPVMKGIFFEVDIKMIEVEVGDAVRCVGKLVDNSWLHIFKLSKMDYNKPLVPRLFSLANFVISNLKSSNDK